ncbi:hypothetical protein SAMN05216490_0175 [Mucilaginibacter mallensis]|uniref:Uncharacterized protein n=2 Tax=Mucilaginibacter mallensis TaxID=652787 RepID=A0A1H1MVX5_MUCMA|nr:hypothetical protein SAMN05216490_0175 [Mucilaginibacter mallensis]
MIKKLLLISIALPLLLSGCAMMQTIVKSTFPYTADLIIPATSVPGKQYESVAMANSLDQDFTKDGNNANKVGEVRIISAKIRSIGPTYFNIGNMISVKIYMSGADGQDEILVASRSNITADVGNNITLDVDNADFLDKLVRLPGIRVRMVYVLRNNTAADTNLRLVLNLGGDPNN